MSGNLRVLSLLYGVCGLVLACERPVAGPVAPAHSGPEATLAAAVADPNSIGEEPVAFTDVSVLLATGGKASGHAEFQDRLAQNIREEKYSFTAVSSGVFPLAKGQVEVHLVRLTGVEVTAHAAVTCLSVVDNQAWVGARVEKLVIGGQEDTRARSMIFRVQDLGERHDAADMASLVFFAAPGGDVAHCAAHPEFPIAFESTIGNIQVKQD